MPARSLLIVPLLLLTSTTFSRADFIVQTAATGPLGFDGGSGIFNNGWIGARFHLDEAVQLDSVGARVVRSGSTGNNQLFLAVAALANSTAFPSPDPQTFSALAVGLLNVTTSPSEASATIDLFLPAGDYALVLGTNRFGATGTGTLINNQTTLTAPLFRFQGAGWEEGNQITDGFRLFATGTVVPVPEPSAIALVATVGGVSAVRGRRRIIQLLRRSFALQLWKKRS